MSAYTDDPGSPTDGPASYAETGRCTVARSDGAATASIGGGERLAWSDAIQAVLQVGRCGPAAFEVDRSDLLVQREIELE